MGVSDSWISLLEPYPGQARTVVNDRIRRNTTIYMIPYYDPRLRSLYTITVSHRISPYTIVFLRIRSRRNTIVILDHVIRQNTVVYGRFCSGACGPAFGRKSTDLFREFPSRFRPVIAGKQRKNPVNSGPEYCYHKIIVNPRNRPFPRRTVRPEYRKEYEQYQVQELLLPILLGNLKKYLENWNIMADNNDDQELIQLFMKWKETLDDIIDPTKNPYHRLIRDVWMPHLEKDISYPGRLLRAPYTVINDRFFSPYITVCLRIRHGDIRS
jgi:hypothetical protein